MPSDAAAAMRGPDDLGLNDEPRAAILRELMDAALQENLFGLRSCLKIRRIATEGLLPIRKDEGYARVENSLAGEAMVFRVRFGDPLQAIRFSRPPVLTFAEDSSRELSPAEVLHWLAGFRSGAALPGQDRLMADLELAESQGRAAREAISAITKELARPRPSLHSWERLAALRDRPFHPVARAKRGWSMEDYRRYSTEGGNGWLLHWIAVRRDRIVRGAVATGDPADWLLSKAERQTLAAGMAVRGIDEADYVALPAHAWQADFALPDLFAEEIAEGVVVPLGVRLGTVRPTSSLRTVIPDADPGVHLKLPLAISSLGTLRPLPPRYLHNGVEAQRLLSELAVRDPVLGGRLRLCDESRWWCYGRDAQDLLANRPGHLACNLRLYPGRGELIPMAGFAASLPGARAPAFDYLLERRGEHGPVAALALFERLAGLLCELGLACFRAGVLPEVHGQNVLVEVDDPEIRGLVLRDHDTLRIHEPWIEAAGLTPPDYRIDRSMPNTLILPAPETLLAYFQTLALQVNLRAIGHTLVRVYAGIDERSVWSVIARALRRAMRSVDLHGAPAAIVESAVFEAPDWPHKLILTPLLGQTVAGTGMPSGLGRVPNPFRHYGGGFA